MSYAIKELFTASGISGGYAGMDIRVGLNTLLIWQSCRMGYNSSRLDKFDRSGNVLKTYFSGWDNANSKAPNLTMLKSDGLWHCYGYGVVSGCGCSSKGTVYFVKPDDSFHCLCTPTDNYTHNLAGMFYFPKYDVFLSGGDASGCNLHIIDPAPDWIAHIPATDTSCGGYIRRIGIIPCQSGRAYIPWSVYDSGGNPIEYKIAQIDLFDLMDNYSTISYLQDLSSWTLIGDFYNDFGLAKAFDKPQYNFIFDKCIVFWTDYVRVDFSTNTANDVTPRPNNQQMPAPLLWDHMVLFDYPNSRIVIKQLSTDEIIQEFSYDYQGFYDIRYSFKPAFVHVFGNRDTQQIKVVAITYKGKAPYVIYNKARTRFAVIDWLTRRSLKCKVKIVWSYTTGAPAPILDEPDWTDEMTVDGWTSIPSKPSTDPLVFCAYPMEVII